jgi:hypothetical protein
MSLGGSAVADATVWPFFIVVASIVLDENAGFRDAQHQFAIKTLIPERTMKAFNMGPVEKATGFNKVRPFEIHHRSF